MPLERYLSHYDNRKLWIEQKSEDEWEINIELDGVFIDPEGNPIQRITARSERHLCRTLQDAKDSLKAWARNTSSSHLAAEPVWRDLTERG